MMKKKEEKDLAKLIELFNDDDNNLRVGIYNKITEMGLSVSKMLVSTKLL
jgi:hypothetical protein